MIGGGPQKITVEIGGKIAASLGKALRESQRQVSTFGRNVNRSMNDAAIAGKKGFKGIFDNALWQGAAVGATAFAAGIGLSVKKAVEFESAMAEVRKVVDGLDDATAFKAISREIISLSREIPITAAGFAEIYAAAGQAGIARNELNRFARSAAQMGVAFDMTAAQAGDAMAKMRTSMQLDQAGVEQLADAMNHLSNSMASSAPEITDFMLRVGAVGKQVAMSTEQTAAFGSAMIAAGAPPEVAATSFRNLVKSLTKGNSATKRQAAAMADLGLTTTGVATSMQKDASGTIQDVFKRLGKVPAEMRVALTSELFGDEARALAPLLTNTELLAKSLAAVGDKAKYTGSMMKEFKSRSKTVANQSTLLKNNMDGLGIAIGSALLPAMNKLFTAATPLIAGLAKWAEKNEGLTTGIVLIGGALAGLVIALPFIAAVVKAIGTIKLALAGLKIGAIIAGYAGVIGPAMGAIVTAITGPIGIAVLAIIGIGLAFKAAYDKIPIFRQVVNATMQKVGQVFTATWTAIKGGFQGFITWVGGAWKMLTGILTFNPARISEGFNQAFNGIKQIATSWLGWMDALWPGFAAGAQAAFAGIVGIAQQAWSAITGAGLGQFVEGIKAQFSGLATFFQGVWGTIVGIFTLDAGRAVAGVKQAFGGLDQIGAGLMQTGLGLGRLILTGIVAGVRGIGAAISGLGRLIVSGLQVIGALMVSTMAAAARSILATWRALPGRIIAGLQTLIGGARSVFDQVVNFIMQTPARVANVGKAVMDTILNGLKSRAGALFGWIRNTWSNISALAGGGAAPAAPTRSGSNRRPPGRALGGPGMDGAIIPRVARPAAAPKAPQVTAPAAAAPKIPPININAPVARQAPAPAPITINAPVTINATGDGAGIRDQVRAAFEDLMATASSGYRVALND